MAIPNDSRLGKHGARTPGLLQTPQNAANTQGNDKDVSKIKLGIFKNTGKVYNIAFFFLQNPMDFQNLKS